MKYIVALAFLGIIASLATALFFMLKKNNASGKSRQQKMAFALGLRVGISILLFASILLSWKLGYLHPTGIASGQ
jgi:hypothetical protein